MVKVLIFGSFDILHPGHLFLIKEAQKYGEVHAGFALDQTIASIKGRMPYHTLVDRMKAIKKYGVIPHAGDPVDRLRVTREVDPKVIVLGFDQHFFVEMLEQYQQVIKPQLQIYRTHLFHKELFSSSKFRDVIEDEQASFILIDKPSGKPSLRTVSRLRKHTNIKRIGFAGTLDPLASGLLICGISKATTLLDWFHFFPKTYEAEMQLGSTSDTYDTESPSTIFSQNEPTCAEIVTTFDSFKGMSMQEPPMYSAKKIEGKRLYELARKGESVERKKRKIEIHSLDVLDYTYPLVRFRVTCSSGTYVRSLINDIGLHLKTGALMSGLRRTAIGPYQVSDALSADSIGTGDWQSLRHLPEELRTQLNSYFWGAFNQ